jgi:hypothetical protein
VTEYTFKKNRIFNKKNVVFTNDILLAIDLSEMSVRLSVCPSVRLSEVIGQVAS